MEVEVKAGPLDVDHSSFHCIVPEPAAARRRRRALAVVNITQNLVQGDPLPCALDPRDAYDNAAQLTMMEMMNFVIRIWADEDEDTEYYGRVARKGGEAYGIVVPAFRGTGRAVFEYYSYGSWTPKVVHEITFNSQPLTIPMELDVENSAVSCTFADPADESFSAGEKAVCTAVLRDKEEGRMYDFQNTDKLHVMLFNGDYFASQKNGRASVVRQSEGVFAIEFTPQIAGTAAALTLSVEDTIFCSNCLKIPVKPGSIAKFDLRCPDSDIDAGTEATCLAEAKDALGNTAGNSFDIADWTVSATSEDGSVVAAEVSFDATKKSFGFA